MVGGSPSHRPRDPVIVGGVAITLIIAGMIACFVPARRATLVDPLLALRSDRLASRLAQRLRIDAKRLVLRGSFLTM